MVRNVSISFGVTTPDEPDISSTRWRTVADHQRMLYFFESALTSGTFRVDLKTVDFASGAPVKRIGLDVGKLR
jgi:choloylglycine hydrolase